MKGHGVFELYGANDKVSRKKDESYNLMFESGFNVDQAVIIEFGIDHEYHHKWTFFGKGVEFFGRGCNSQYNISVNLFDGKRRGEIILDSIKPSYRYDLGKNPPTKSTKIKLSKQPEFLPVKLSFMAEYNNKKSKKNGVYMSQDPIIIVGKPKRP